MKRFLIRAGAVALAAFSVSAVSAQTHYLRIVSYNIDCEDRGSDGNITNATHSLPTVVQAIGLHHLGTNAQPMDVMSCEELNPGRFPTLSRSLTAFTGRGLTLTTRRLIPIPAAGRTESFI